MRNTTGLTLAALVLSGLSAASDCPAMPVNSGNELARKYSEARTPERREELRKEAVDHLYFFRFLKIVKKEEVTGGKRKGVLFEGVEPSSDAVVSFTVKKSISMKIISTLSTNDCMAVQGRVQSIGSEKPTRIELDPVIVKFKDHAAPKLGQELLREVDPTAK